VSRSKRLKARGYACLNEKCGSDTKKRSDKDAPTGIKRSHTREFGESESATSKYETKHGGCVFGNDSDCGGIAAA
jgi:hypothetical protein